MYKSSRSLSELLAIKYLLKLLPNNVVDRRLLSPMLGFVHAGLGEVTTRIRISDLAVELAAVGVQMIADRFGPTSVTGRGAAISLGGLRLAGGTLATVGGVYLVVLDVRDTSSSFKRGLYSLGYAYMARAVVSGGITVLATVISISYTAPLLRWALGANSQWGGLLLLENLGSSRFIPLLLRLIGAGTLITLALSVAIAVLAPDEMEEWCWHSCLGKSKDNFFKPYKDQKTELEKLYQALKAVN